MFDEKDGDRLIKIAKESIASYFDKKDVNVSESDKKRFGDKLGVFVTLKIDGELRGCIGYVEGAGPLYEGVIGAAQSAAFGDPRFMPLSKDEFAKIKIEVSVLSKPVLIEVSDASDYLSKIKVGRDGLIIKGSGRSGLLLPQVPGEFGWGIKEFLENICMKAGLDSDAWKETSNKIYSFKAQVFEE